MNRVQSSCITCLLHIFYWNKEIRQLYLFDIEFYRLLFKALLISFNLQLKQNDTVLHSNCQEDLSALLFILLYNQVSSLDYYYENVMDTQRMNKKSTMIQFDLSANLKNNINEPFSITPPGLQSSDVSKQSELKQQENQQWQAYELNFRLNSILKKKLEFSNEKTDINFKEILDKKFRLYWNIMWHGGSLAKLCNDLLYNQQMVQQRRDSSNFSDNLCLTDDDKFVIKYSSPFYLMKQFCDEISKCATHEDALNLLDLTQILITIIDGNKKFDLGINQADDECTEAELEFYSSNTLNVFFNRQKSDWPLALNRFASILPSNKSKSDQLLFSNSFQTIAKMLNLQSNYYDSNLIASNTNKQLMLVSPDVALDEINSIISIDKWLFNMTYNPSSTLVLMIKQFLIDYETDELRIK